MEKKTFNTIRSGASVFFTSVFSAQKGILGDNARACRCWRGRIDLTGLARGDFTVSLRGDVAATVVFRFYNRCLSRVNHNSLARTFVCKSIIVWPGHVDRSTLALRSLVVFTMIYLRRSVLRTPVAILDEF